MRSVFIYLTTISFMFSGCSLFSQNTKPKEVKIEKAKEYKKSDVKNTTCYIPNTLLVERKPMKLLTPEQFEKLSDESKWKYISALAVTTDRKLYKTNKQIREIREIIIKHNKSR